MARPTSNVMIEQQDNGTHRPQAFNAPAIETANARVHMIGPFRHAAVAASLSGVAMTLGGVDSGAAKQIPAHSSGVILGVAYEFDALLTAGGTDAATLQPTVAPGAVASSAAAAGAAVDVASAASGNPQTGLVDQTPTFPTFNKGDGLGLQLSTNSALSPTTSNLAAWLIVRFDPSPGVPS